MLTFQAMAMQLQWLFCDIFCVTLRYNGRMLNWYGESSELRKDNIDKKARILFICTKAARLYIIFDGIRI